MAFTLHRTHTQEHQKRTWVVLSYVKVGHVYRSLVVLCSHLFVNDANVASFVLPDGLWRDRVLQNFVSCKLSTIRFSSVHSLYINIDQKNFMSLLAAFIFGCIISHCCTILEKHWSKFNAFFFLKKKLSNFQKKKFKQVS